MQVLWLILILPGLIFAYVVILRPVLRKVPAFQRFYSDADTFWGKAWALCGNSLTIAGHYVIGGFSAMLVFLDPIGNLIGDPELKSQVENMLQSNPKALGYFTFAISVLTIFFRIRSMFKDVSPGG